MEPRRSPLDAAHRALGARMVPFGGWEMPLSYGHGTVHEHMACRERAVVFDVSHLGTVRVTGAGAYDLLQEAFTNDLGRIGPGRAQYTHLLDADDASTLDDIIVWWVHGGPGDPSTRFDVMPNASNTARVVQALEGPASTATDVTSERAVLAVQGPTARDRLGAMGLDVTGIGRFAVGPFSWRGTEGVAAGTGYTGEDGVELAVPAAVGADLWGALVDAGIEPAGLGARDTLRLEAGLPLHGHELGPGVTPLQAGLGWVVAWSKPSFRGRAPLAAERERGPARRLRGLRLSGRQPARDGATVRIGAQDVGVVTSGNFSPLLGVAVAMAFLPPATEDDTEVALDVRGRSLDARVVPLPFVPNRSTTSAGKGR